MPKESKGEQANNATPRSTSGRFRRLFSRRNVLLALFSTGALLLLFGLLGIVSYRTGLIDSYIKSQFIDKMNYIGIEFTADEFRVGASPLELVLKNAQFNDRVSGEKLFFVENARIGLSVENLFAWQLSRDISVTSTDISGAQVWIKFDENGRSNFANIVEDTRESRLNFKYDTVKLNISDSVIHFNDLSRSIGAEARNFRLTLAPEAGENGGPARYAIDITSSDSNFRYDDRTVEDISIRAKLLANSESGEVKELRIDTPLGTSYLKGVISNWAEFAYDLSIESSVDLTRASSIFPLGASLGGVGNFKGRVSGRGERYKIAGVVDSQAISAESVYLRGLNVDATVEGTNRNYEANGKAIAELLTFEDFRIEFPQIFGNVRGTGTDFRWVGELQAIAAKSRSLTLGRLFLSDAVAEYKEEQLTATVGNGRAQRFSVADFEFSEMVVRDLNLRRRNGELQLSAPTARAASLKSKDIELTGMRGEGVSVSDKGERTQVRVNRLVAESGRIKDTRGQKISAEEFQLVDLPGSTELTAKDLRVDRTIIEGARIDGLNSPFITLRDNERETIVYSDKLRVAKIDTGSAVLGSLNIAGVRLTIRQGRLQATSNDIDAGNIQLAGTETFPEGGTLENVGIAKPIFVLEPSGRYRATADMSIGGGIIGSISLGSATARVDINNDRAAFDDLVAEVMNGKLEGNAAIALNRRGETIVRGDFRGLDLSKLIAVRSGRVMPIAGPEIDLPRPGDEHDNR
ncbi:hypothetical protein [Leptolyngbya sp. 7M]|uniref:hypothetical protein n=1 Tax=Leptolyngbya sp. 7M TaxID=2812896 RepID=UPI001B8AA112|nr:hypothetical protein [Leptolyngbya sp. 7M]QYO67305.1 hypothetical protein JVX88_11155 [Leptolyngbya sp. 7M]